MTMTVTITEEQWEERYKPLGELLETYGEDWERVQSVPPKNVWTLYEGDWGTYIYNGIHIVNRVGYYISELPWNDGEELEVVVSKTVGYYRYDCQADGRCDYGCGKRPETLCADCYTPSMGDKWHAMSVPSGDDFTDVCDHCGEFF